jgi:hypothetical protein
MSEENPSPFADFGIEFVTKPLAEAREDPVPSAYAAILAGEEFRGEPPEAYLGKLRSIVIPEPLLHYLTAFGRAMVLHFDKKDRLTLWTAPADEAELCARAMGERLGFPVWSVDSAGASKRYDE